MSFQWYMCKYCMTPFVSLQEMIVHNREFHPQMERDNPPISPSLGGIVKTEPLALTPINNSESSMYRLHQETPNGFPTRQFGEWPVSIKYEELDYSNMSSRIPDGETANINGPAETKGKKGKKRDKSKTESTVPSTSNSKLSPPKKKKGKESPQHIPKYEEAPFKCDECGKQFFKNNSFKAHKKRHTLELNFPCTYCEKKFAERFNLNRHLLSHTKEKPFQCKLCGTQFTYRYNLITHEGIHHPEVAAERIPRTPRNVLYKCRHCDFTNSRKKVVSKHELRHNLDVGVSTVVSV